MTEYAVTVSVCGGSQAEAADPDLVVGPFHNATDAQAYADALFAYCSARSDTCRQEMLATAHRVTPPGAPVEEVAEHVFGFYWEDEDED